MITFKRFRELFSGVPIVIPEYVLENAYEKLKGALQTEVETPAQQVVAFYISEYQARFGKRPIFEGKDGKRIKSIMDTGISLERMKKLVLAYLEMKDPYFVERGHDLFTFMNSVNRIARVVDTSAPRPIVLPNVTKPTMEIHPKPVEPEPLMSEPPPDVKAKLRSLAMGAAAAKTMPAGPPKQDPEERKQDLRRQAALLEHQRKKRETK